MSFETKRKNIRFGGLSDDACHRRMLLSTLETGVVMLSLVPAGHCVGTVMGTSGVSLLRCFYILGETRGRAKSSANSRIEERR